jgi:hypothetical protein
MALIDRDGSLANVHLETDLIPDVLWHSVIARLHPSLDAGKINLGYHNGLVVGFAGPKLSEHPLTTNSTKADQGADYTQPRR